MCASNVLFFLVRCGSWREEEEGGGGGGHFSRAVNIMQPKYVTIAFENIWCNLCMGMFTPKALCHIP